MNQFSIFETPKTPKEKATKSKSNLWNLYIDGASRNNPGLAGAGVYLLKSNKSVLKKSFFLGTKTNNQAEYLALLLGLFSLENLISIEDEIHIFSDSELLIKQLNGEYKVKNPNLKILLQCALSFLEHYDFKAEHIEREKNNIADKLANRGIDLQKDLPSKNFYKFRERYK